MFLSERFALKNLRPGVEGGEGPLVPLELLAREERAERERSMVGSATLEVCERTDGRL